MLRPASNGHTVRAQVLQNGQPVIVPVADGATLPSVVAFQDDGNVLVGKAAKRCEGTLLVWQGCTTARSLQNPEP